MSEIHTEVKSQEIQNSSDMLIGEGYNLNNPGNIPGFKQTTNFKPHYAQNKNEKKKGTIARFFSNMSRLGMTYDDKVIDNMRAIPADKNFLPKQDQLLNQDLFTQLNSAWKVKSNADKGFFEKDYPTKREALRKLALQPELEDILDTMSNEAIVYDTDLTYFAEPFIEIQELHDIKKEFRHDIEDKMGNYFRKFYKMLNWKYNAWDDFKRWLIEGILAWEIVYDKLDKPTEIIGLIPIDPATLTKKYENNKWYWIQYKGIQGKERKLLDSQVIYITYQETNCINRVSYLERLIRPFNIYRIVEQAQLIWTITNSSYKMKFTIPVKGMNKTMGMQTLSSAMNRYKEDIKFIADSGELSINGQATMPFNKEYWFPENDSGSPSIETLGGDGPELNDNDQLKYYKNCRSFSCFYYLLSATIASIIASETNKNEEYPIIASIYINRLNKGIALQACPTVIFAVGDFSMRRVLKRHLAIDSPYNTYKHRGLPPGPIRLARPDVIDAVLNAPKTDYLYMCANPDFSGTHVFSSSYTKHSAVAREYQRALNQRKVK